MAKSGTRRGGPFAPAAVARGFAAPGRQPSVADLLPRAKPALDLESALAKAGAKAAAPSLPGLPTGASKAKQSAREAEEAKRCAAEGVALVQQRRSRKGSRASRELSSYARGWRRCAMILA